MPINDTKTQQHSFLLFLRFRHCEKTLCWENPDFYKLHPHFGKFLDMPRFTVDSIFIMKFCDSVRVFHITEIIGAYLHSSTRFPWNTPWKFQIYCLFQTPGGTVRLVKPF